MHNNKWVSSSTWQKRANQIVFLNHVISTWWLQQEFWRHNWSIIQNMTLIYCFLIQIHVVPIWSKNKFVSFTGHRWIPLTKASQIHIVPIWSKINLYHSPVTGEFSSQRPVTRSFGVFVDLCLNKRLSKQSWGWWFETPSWSLWRHRNDYHLFPQISVSTNSPPSVRQSSVRLCWSLKHSVESYN